MIIRKSGINGGGGAAAGSSIGTGYRRATYTYRGYFSSFAVIKKSKQEIFWTSKCIGIMVCDILKI